MRTYRSQIAVALALMVSASLSSGVVYAVKSGHFDGGHLGGDWRWGGHGIDVDRWHGGHWLHGEHLGRLGWWWVVGESWYFYPTPVYPHPDPHIPPAVVAPSGYWYYCASASAYYPYVPECPEGWRPVVLLPRLPGSLHLDHAPERRRRDAGTVGESGLRIGHGSPRVLRLVYRTGSLLPRGADPAA